MSVFFQKNIFITFLLLILFSEKSVAQNSGNFNPRVAFDKATDLEFKKNDSAAYYYSKCIELLKNNYSDKLVSKSFHRLTCINIDRSDYKKAVEYGLEAIRSFENQKDTVHLTISLINLALAMEHQQKYTEASIYSNRAKSLAEKKENDSLMILAYISKSDLNNYNSLSARTSLDTSIFYLNKAYQISLGMPSKAFLGSVLNNLGNTYYNIADNYGNKNLFRKVNEYAEKAAKHLDSIKNHADLAYSHGLIGAANMQLGNYRIAEEAYQKALNFYKDIHSNFNLETIYSELTLLYIKLNKKEQAEASFYSYDSIMRLVINEKNEKSISEMQTKYETKQKEEQNQKLIIENELSNTTIKQQKTQAYFIITGLVLSLLLAILIFRGLRQQRAANKIISEQKSEVEQQKHLVEEKQKEIIDSIRYAKRIQQSLLPTEKYIERNLKK